MQGPGPGFFLAEVSSGEREGAEGPLAVAPLTPPLRLPTLSRMNYLLAILLPPLSILIAGRPIVAILTFLIWIPALIFSGGLTHPMFILLAWFIIFSRANRHVRPD